MSALTPVLCSAATLTVYFGAQALHRRVRRPWAMPLMLAPVVLIALLLGLRTSYRVYADSTAWLVMMLGPATVAFAVPIYEQRSLIRRQWRVLLAGGLAGTTTAIGTSWGLARALGLDRTLQLSLMPRSTSTPFAVEVSARIGGAPELTAIFVIVTGIFGALVGEWWLGRLRVQSSAARGALFGAAAHGLGTTRAYELGQGEGAVAALMMVTVGLLNVLAAPVLALALR